MNILLDTPLLTPDDLLNMGDDGKGYELVDGRLVVTNRSVLSCLVAGRLFTLLAVYCEANRLGWLLPQDSGFQYDPNSPRKVRKPDAAFIRRERLPESAWSDGYCHVVPDLAVEVISPNDTFDEVDTKVEEYLRLGVQLVWVVSLQTRQVYVHRRDGTIAKVRENGELTGENLIPGFRCRVSELFPTATIAGPAANGSQS
jgi:Uma2 family endonuclease